MATIKGFTINVLKTATFQDLETQYGIEIVLSETTAIKKLYRAEMKSFFPDYQAKRTRQNYTLASILQEIESGVLANENTTGMPAALSYDVSNNETVIVDGQEVGKFDSFKYLSETGALRVPENLINGILDNLTKKPDLFGSSNPIYINRQYAISNYEAEVFAQDYSAMQPLVCEIGNVQAHTPGQEDGEISLLLWESQGTITASIDGGAFSAVVDGHVFSGLAEGEHTLIVKDDITQVTYKVTV